MGATQQSIGSNRGLNVQNRFRFAQPSEFPHLSSRVVRLGRASGLSNSV
jgi:hypothetical protein